MSPPLPSSAANRRLAGFAAAFLIVTVGALRASAADATAPAQRMNPDGVSGTLILCGGKVPDGALDQFRDLAGKERASLVVLRGGDDAGREAADKLADALRARKSESVAVLEADSKDPKTLETLQRATGVWVVGGRPGAVEAAKKRLVVGVSGAAPAGDALGLLPGAVIDPDFRAADGVDRMFASLDKAPGAFGVGLGEGAALVVRGRKMSAVGDGAVTVFLAKAPAKPRRVLEITEEAPSDLTMLRRAAIARAGAPFPPKAQTMPDVASGALVIVGGGGMPADVTQRFIELAGGPDAHIVVLPTANPGAAADSENGVFKRAGANNVVGLSAVKLEEVEDPKNLEALKRADAIWFGGGRQWHFVDAYEGTKALELFRDVLRRGGVIGGSSAGATIQGDYLCRGSPLNNTDEMCEGYERGFGFLPGVAIDQHFAQRNRFADMTGLMKTYPQLLGVGLDEGTAIVVKGHEATVMGKGEVHFYDRTKPPADGKPDYESLKAGGRYDLKARKALDGGGAP